MHGQENIKNEINIFLLRENKYYIYGTYRMGAGMATQIHQVGYGLEEHINGCFVYCSAQTGSGSLIAI
jgi:hypothetical protein